MELIVVIAFIGVLSAIAYPSFSQWRENAQYKEVARQLVSAMMQAKGKAISTNLEHEMEFDLGANTYLLRQGNRASNTRLYSAYPGDWEEIHGDQSLPGHIDLRAQSDCSDNSSSSYRIQFLPNGTMEINDTDDAICLLDKSAGVNKFRAAVTSATTGRVVLEKWNGSSWD